MLPDRQFQFHIRFDKLLLFWLVYKEVGLLRVNNFIVELGSYNMHPKLPVYQIWFIVIIFFCSTLMDFDRILPPTYLTQLPVWTDWEKFRHIGKNEKVCGHFLKGYFVLGSTLILLRQSLNAIGLILIVSICQILNK